MNVWFPERVKNVELISGKEPQKMRFAGFEIRTVNIFNFIMTRNLLAAVILWCARSLVAQSYVPEAQALIKIAPFRKSRLIALILRRSVITGKPVCEC
jgi:hypothetical protein